MPIFKRNNEINYKAEAEKIIDKYGNAILRLAYSYLHNTQDAEDVVQDTIIKYLETKPSFDNETFEKAWLMRVASNISKNKIKYNQVREYTDIDDCQISEQKEDYSDVLEAVNSLPEKYRVVIHLFYYEKYSTKEIASIIDSKDSTVRTMLKRGRERLKEILQEAFDFEE